MTEVKTSFLDSLRELLGEAGVLFDDGAGLDSAEAKSALESARVPILRPRSVSEVSQAMALCHAANQPVVCQGGRTGLVGGTLTGDGELILSLERLSTIESIDAHERTATVQAGVTLHSLQTTVEAMGLYYPIDFGARGTATLGGSIATNAGGNRVIRYGMTRASVLGLEVVLADGTVVSSMNAMLKNNTGYDLKQLFIGSEGTLGVVTRAVLRLHEMPSSVQTALVGCEEFSCLPRLLKHMDGALGGQLAAFEVMWSTYFDLVSSPPASGRSPFSSRYPYYVLLEAVGSNVERDAERFEAALGLALEEGLGTDVVLARSMVQRDSLWRLRESVHEMAKHGPLHSFDVSLPISQMEAYTTALTQAIAQAWPAGRCWVFGHMGDGNLHVTVAPGTDDAACTQQLRELVYGPLQAMRGAVSAEHGIGVEKRDWLHISRSDSEIDLMRKLKSCLDPKNLLNPGKVINDLRVI